MKSKTILCLFSILIGLIGLEVLLRLAWTNPYAHTTPDRVLKIRIHHRNIVQKIDRHLIDNDTGEVLLRTDGRHYIMPSFRFADPDFVVVFMGGSTTECVAVQEEMRFHHLVSQKLEERGIKVNALNIARSGGTLHDSINTLVNHVVMDKPDVVLLMNVVNDIGLLEHDGDYASRMGHDISFADIAKYSAQLGSIHFSTVGFIRHRTTTRPNVPRPDDRASPGGCGLDSEPYIARLKAFVGICRAFDAVPVLLTEPVASSVANELTPEWIDESCQRVFNQAVRDVGRETGTDVIDLEALLAVGAKTTDELNKIFYDGMHVTDYGSAVYASYISEGLSGVLDRLRTRDELK